MPRFREMTCFHLINDILDSRALSPRTVSWKRCSSMLHASGKMIVLDISHRADSQTIELISLVQLMCHAPSVVTHASYARFPG